MRAVVFLFQFDSNVLIVPIDLLIKLSSIPNYLKLIYLLDKENIISQKLYT